MARLEFRNTHIYSGDAVTLPIQVISGENAIDVLATIDTGSSNCLFERLHAELLGLDLTSGERRCFVTATGSVETYGHLVQITGSDASMESMVYFFENPDIKKNLLGRTGWLDRVRLGVIHYDRELYLAPYEF
jgi:hypothetical protein